jgi:hypothetical protein
MLLSPVSSCEVVMAPRGRPAVLHVYALGIALWITTMVAPLQAYGPNLLANPTFDFGIAGWPEHPGTICAPEWAPRDAGGSITSGSIRFPCRTTTGQCVPVEGGNSYIVAATAWIPFGGTEDGFAQAAALWYENSTCSGDASGDGPYASDRGRWVNAARTVVAPPSARSAQFVIVGSPGVHFDNIFFGTGACAPNSTQLCLNEGRFQVRATWTTADNTSGPGIAVPFAADSGSFWFFGPTNIELNVKVLNACVPSLGNHYWVFAAGLTDVGVVLTVTDTKTGAVRTYTSPQGTAFQPITDTSAFSTCP